MKRSLYSSLSFKTSGGTGAVMHGGPHDAGSMCAVMSCTSFLAASFLRLPTFRSWLAVANTRRSLSETSVSCVALISAVAAMNTWSASGERSAWVVSCIFRVVPILGIGEKISERRSTSSTVVVGRGQGVSLGLVEGGV